MNSINITSLVLAFLEGLGLILSPCILPILPIMLAASLDGGKRRPLGIITGFIGAFTAFALLSRQILSWLHADPEVVRNTALIILIIFGMIMLSRKLSDKLLAGTQGLANLGQNLTSRWDQSNGYFGGVAIGAMIGLIWTPCAGPIMAAAVVQIIQAKNTLEATLTVLMFALGAGIPMLLIALLGRSIMTRLTFLKTHSYGVRRALGIVIILTAVLIYKGADVQLLANANMSSPSEAVTDNAPEDVLLKPLANPYPAPELGGIEDWINSSQLRISELRDKVILVDFWTYSCINCVRTLPYLTAWDRKYHDQGLVIIGVHSPEFDFEKKLENVKNATIQYNIHYPVALDNNLVTWGNFANKYWPAHYLINKEGQVVYIHYGEGDYDITEHNIRVLLGLNEEASHEEIGQASVFSNEQTPETYLGYERAKNFMSSVPVKDDEPEQYIFPNDLKSGEWALNGGWLVEGQRISSTRTHAAIRLHFKARKVFVVLGTNNGKKVRMHVWLNGQPAGIVGGADVKNSLLTINSERLYEIIDQGEMKDGVLELQSDNIGLQAYAFTFGE